MKAVAIVLDSVGLGYLPDAPLFGDEGADTLDHTVLKTGIALPHLAGLGLGLVKVVMAQEVKQAMHEQQAELVGLGGAKGRGLPGDVGGREHDVTELAGLAGRERGVVRALALEADHVRGAVDAAPLQVELAHALLPHQGEGDHARAPDALALED